MSNSAPAREEGFTLIEVLVALTILSISLVVLMQIIGANLDRLRESAAQTTAISLTQSLLDQLGLSMPVRLGESAGDFGNGFRWHVQVEPYGSAEERKVWLMLPVVVTASTVWNGERRSLTLTTLRLIPKDER